MTGWLLTYIVLTALAGLGSLTAAVLIWRRRRVPGAWHLGVMMASCALWCLCAVGELLATTTMHTLFWAKLSYFAIVAIGPSWLLFCLSYTGRLPTAPRSRAWLQGSLAVVPALTVFFIYLWPQVRLMWSSLPLSPPRFGQPLLMEHGPWFPLWVGFSYLALLLGSSFLLYTVLRYVKILTAQALTLVLAIALPLLTSLAYVFEYRALRGLDITAPALAISGALVIFAIKRLEALDVSPAVVPEAHATLWEDMRDGVVIVDHHLRVLSANHAAEALLAGTEETLAGRQLNGLFGGAQLPLPGEEPAFDDLTPSEIIVHDASGTERYLEILASRLGGEDHVGGYALVMRDITRRKQLEEELRSRVWHYELTGLPNRGALREELARALRGRKSKSASPQLAVFLISFAHFREINGTFGHEAGDKLLRSAARRLRTKCDASAFVARLDGDKFAVVLSERDAAVAIAAAASLRRQLTAPFSVHRQKVLLPACIGIALHPHHGSDASTLLRHADVARIAAKESPQGVALYRAEEDPNSPQRLALLHELRKATATGALTLNYQPEIELASQRVIRVEALARWPQADGSTILPGEFIPLAEQNGLLPAISTWALNTALAQLGAREETRDVSVAVNLSPIDLRDPGLVRRVERALEKTGAHPDSLWLEITETSIMHDPEQARRLLTDLRRLGVCTAIDDFGVGHSSLAYLHTLPACDVKIDASFTRDVDSRSSDAAIVRAIATLAHDLGLTVTAEGVETPSALDCLRELGCDHVQGYVIARPMPAADVTRWIRTWQGKARQPDL